MTRNAKAPLALGVAALLAACASVPAGPTLTVLPGANKPFEVFRADDADCRSFAASQVSLAVEDANNRAVGAAVLTAALAAAAGAAIGAAGPRVSSSAGEGAAVGAGVGALAGAGIGASASGEERYTIQQQYDVAYAQCMYSRGNQVPGFTPANPAPPPPGFAPPRPRYRY